MANNLIKKIGQAVFKMGAPLFLGGLSLINSGCAPDPKVYEIDGKNIQNYSKSGPTTPRQLFNPNLHLIDNNVHIYGTEIESMRIKGLKPYRLSNKTHEDSVVINEAQKKVDYWLKAIDSTEEAERIRTGLDALK